MIGLVLLTIMFLITIALCIAFYAEAKHARREQREAEIRAYAAIAMLIAATEERK